MRKIFFALCFCIGAGAFGLRAGEQIPASICKRLTPVAARTYVVDFFASWCTSCRHELPQIEKLSRRLADRNITIVGVDVDEVAEEGRAFRRALGLSFRVVEDPAGKIVASFDPAGIPALYIVSGCRVRGAIIGAHDDIDKLLLQILAR